MPEISRFFGISISLNYRDHAPPHFHVRYAERRAAVVIRPLRLLSGSLPPRILGFVIEWAALHGQELLVEWDRTSIGLPPRRIPPLE
jgi:hypothetical protein